MEKEYLEKMKDWERFDRQLHEALEELKENVDAIIGEVAECKIDISKNYKGMQDNTAKIEEKSKILTEHTAEMERIRTHVDQNAKCIKEGKKNVDRKIQENKDGIETLKVQMEDSNATIKENIDHIEENRTTIARNRKDIQTNQLATHRISEEMDLIRKAQGMYERKLFGYQNIFKLKEGRICSDQDISKYNIRDYCCIHFSLYPKLKNE